MNLLYVLHKDPYIFLGGVERHVTDLIRAFSLKGQRIFIMFPSSSHLVVSSVCNGSIEEMRLKGHFCDDMTLHNSVVEKSFGEILQRFSIDIVHFQHLSGYPLSLIEEARRAGARVIISTHDYFFWCPSYKLLSPLCGNRLSFCYFEKDSARCAKCLALLGVKNVDEEKVRKRREYVYELFGMADAIVMPSLYVQDVFCALYPSATHKALMIEHGVKTNGVMVPNDKTSDPLKVAYLGAFTFEKGADMFLDLMRDIKDADLFPKVSFSIIGELGYNIPDDLLQSNGLKVTGAYRPDELNTILNREGIDIVLLLSRWPETYSYTLSEAIASGIPVIASDLGALRERIARYTVGYLVPAENPVPRTLSVIDDFLTCPELFSFFRQRCAAAARQLPGVDEMVKNYFEIYQL
jgi:glycosyltransferase involved in cell wall biosynthesis